MDLGRRTTFEDQDFDLGVVKARIGYVCQEGYYPGQEHVNQDACCVVPNFEGNGDEIFLGVFDGHGENSEVRSPPRPPPPPTPSPPSPLAPPSSLPAPDPPPSARRRSGHSSHILPPHLRARGWAEALWDGFSGIFRLNPCGGAEV